MNRLAAILPVEQVLVGVDATSKKRAFEQAGLLSRHHFESGKAVYELNEGGHHDHLVCLQCGHVEEFFDSEIEKRQDRRPQLSDLRESGSLEERAKCVVMLHRPAYYDEREPEDLVELIVRKNNQGRCGTATAVWDGPTIRMHGGRP